MSTTYAIPTPTITPRTTSSTAWRAAMALNAVVASVGLAIKFGESATTADPLFPTV